MQTAIEGLGNVAQVDVSLSSDATYTYYTVTFLSNLGSVPLMGVSTGGSNVYVQRLQGGVTEVQTITLASDVQDVREVQQFLVPDSPSPSSTTLSLSFAGKKWVDVDITTLTNNGLTQALSAIVGTDNSTLTVAVSNVYSTGLVGTIWSVTFLTPVGDVPPLGVALGRQNNAPITTITILIILITHFLSS